MKKWTFLKKMSIVTNSDCMKHQRVRRTLHIMFPIPKSGVIPVRPPRVAPMPIHFSCTLNCYASVGWKVNDRSCVALYSHASKSDNSIYSRNHDVWIEVSMTWASAVFLHHRACRYNLLKANQTNQSINQSINRTETKTKVRKVEREKLYKILNERP